MAKNVFLLTIVFFCFFMFNCNNIKKQNVAIDVTTEIADTVNFDEFLVKFSTDSDFQFAHIDFPLTVIWLENEVTGVEKDTTLYLNKKDWQFKDFIDGTKYNVFYKKFRTETGFEIFAAGNQTGVAVTYLFEKRENTWFLVRMEDSSD